jgi:hypothetical protein
MDRVAQAHSAVRRYPHRRHMHYRARDGACACADLVNGSLKAEHVVRDAMRISTRATVMLALVCAAFGGCGSSSPNVRSADGARATYRQMESDFRAGRYSKVCDHLTARWIAQLSHALPHAAVTAGGASCPELLARLAAAPGRIPVLSRNVPISVSGNVASIGKVPRPARMLYVDGHWQLDGRE